MGFEHEQSPFNDLTPAQVGNLTVLGKVWGFLKYHHPRVTAGKLRWDYELFRVVPKILACQSSAAARQEMHAWIARIGGLDDCTQCASLDETGLQMRPRLDWLSDKELLGAELSDTLRAIYRNRTAKGKQFYVAKTAVGSAVFRNEPAYTKLKLPVSSYQLLALFRFWNIIEYWFPYRDIIGEDWDAVLCEFIPKVTLARTRDAYQIAMMALIARVHDTHANLWSSLDVRPPVGRRQAPVGAALHWQ